MMTMNRCLRRLLMLSRRLGMAKTTRHHFGGKVFMPGFWLHTRCLIIIAGAWAWPLFFCIESELGHLKMH